MYGTWQGCIIADALREEDKPAVLAMVARHIGPDGLAASVATYLAAFPDLRFTVEEVVVQSNRIVQVWRAHATHRGSLMNIPPTGLRIEVRGASVLTYRGDKLYRALYIWDVAGLLRSIGLLPEL